MYDLTIIGAGPGGYAAAIKAADSGAKVCIIEKDLLGGVCLNRGCVPTKTIISSLEVLSKVKRASEFGIDVGGYNVDIVKINRRKEEVVSRLRQGVEAMLKSKGVDILRGAASIYDKDTVIVEKNPVSTRYIIIATGSVPIENPPLVVDHRHILSSDDVLNLEGAPESMIIVGGGAIGCEFASIYSQLGCKVTVIEALERLLPKEDGEIAARLEAHFKKSGIGVYKGLRVSSVKVDDNVNPAPAHRGGIKIFLEGSREVEADAALLCIGRRPNTAGLDIDKVGIIYENGIKVDENLRTNVPNIYAIGDVTARYYLAHTASYEGTVAADNIFGKTRPADYSAVPNCIFTTPQIASVGLTEEMAQSSGRDFSVTKVPFTAVSKAHILGETEGIIKVISDKKTGKILGAHIFGASASELICNFTIAIRRGITVKELSEVIYAHPTLSEIVPEAVFRIK